MCPPDDQPWLISSRGELDRDAEKMEIWKSDWKSDFPGLSSSFSEKVAWIKKVDDKHSEEDYYDTMDGDAPDESEDVIAGILSDCCPVNVTLQMWVPRVHLEGLTLTAANGSTFMSATSIHRAGYPSTVAGWSDYKTWLLALDTADPDVLIATIDCNKEQDLGDALNESMLSLGLQRHASTFTIPGPGNDSRSFSGRFLQQKIGQNIHFPLVGGATGVAVKVGMTATEKQRQSSPFVSELISLQKASGDTKIFIIVPKHDSETSDSEAHDSDEDDVNQGSAERALMSSETQHTLWLPAAYTAVDERVRSHCCEGEGESKGIQRRLQKGNTDTGNLKLAILGAEFEALKTLKGPQTELKFCTALALTRAMAWDSTWMHDNESPEDTVAMVNKLGEYWRNSLLKKSDAELGLGLGGAGASEAHSGPASRLALFRLFETIAPRLKLDLEGDYGDSSLKCHFNWVARKRRSGAEVAAEKAKMEAQKAAKKAKKASNAVPASASASSASDAHILDQDSMLHV